MQTIFEHLRYSNKEFFAKDATESTLDLQIYLLKSFILHDLKKVFFKIFF